MSQANRWTNSILRYGEEAPDQLLANPSNWRIHPASQKDALIGSLNELGWITPVIVNETTGNLVDGHARVGEAIARGEAAVPVAYVRLTPAQEALALATLDPISAIRSTHRLRRLPAANVMEWARQVLDPGITRIAGSQKHRYLMPLDAAMRAQLLPLARPYPKRPCATSISADASAVQAEDGGSTPTVALPMAEVI